MNLGSLNKTTQSKARAARCPICYTIWDNVILYQNNLVPRERGDVPGRRHVPTFAPDGVASCGKRISAKVK